MEGIGFIGLGAMGKPMAENLLRAGYPLHILTRTRAKVEDLLAAGAIWHDTPRQIGAASDVVITILPDTPDVERAVAGPEGILEGARPGTLIIDMSTISPMAARRMAAEVEARGCDFLDAPVSGGEIGAKAGTLSIMAGGREAAFARAVPIFQVMGKTILRIGDSGAGQITKAANQIIISATIEAVAEALAFAAKAGVDPAKVRQALLGGSAKSRLLETHGVRMIERTFQPGFRMRLNKKDLDICLDAGRTYGAALPVAARVQELMAETLRDGQGDLDNSSFILLIEKLSEQLDKPA
jgi:2-hydroxy-3-oxopropionate reductase